MHIQFFLFQINFSTTVDFTNSLPICAKKKNMPTIVWVWPETVHLIISSPWKTELNMKLELRLSLFKWQTNSAQGANGWREPELAALRQTSAASLIPFGDWLLHNLTQAWNSPPGYFRDQAVLVALCIFVDFFFFFKVVTWQTDKQKDKTPFRHQSG